MKTTPNFNKIVNKLNYMERKVYLVLLEHALENNFSCKLTFKELANLCKIEYKIILNTFDTTTTNILSNTIQVKYTNGWEYYSLGSFSYSKTYLEFNLSLKDIELLNVFKNELSNSL